jgi:hypothetical protein
MPLAPAPCSSAPGWARRSCSWPRCRWSPSASTPSPRCSGPCPDASSAAPARRAGIALINSFGNLGGYLGPFAIGALKEYTGNLASGLYFLSAVLCFGLLLTGIVYQRLERRQAQQPAHLGGV